MKTEIVEQRNGFYRLQYDVWKVFPNTRNLTKETAKMIQVILDKQDSFAKEYLETHK